MGGLILGAYIWGLDIVGSVPNPASRVCTLDFFGLDLQTDAR